MEKKEDVFEYREGKIPKRDMYEPIKPEPALSPLFWVIIVIFVILVLINMFWEYIESIGPSAFLPVVIFILFIIINIFSALKRKKR